MGYDYTKKFLDENAATVNQLTELYNTQGVVAMAYDEREKLDSVRFRVSNVLAAMALHYPSQFKDLRDKIRTWSNWDKDKEQWVLFIGAPRHKIAGRKPGILPLASQVSYGPAAQTGRVEEIYSKLISTPEEFARFVQWVATLGPSVRRIRAELSDPPDNERFLRPFKAVGWKPDIQNETTIILRRPDPHPEDRNA